MKKKPARILGEVLRHLFKKPATVAYPFEKAKLYPRFRGRIDFESDKCIGCKMCMRVCPANAIDIILSAEQPPAPKVEAGQTPPPAKKKFDCIMNLDRCIYCAQCVEVCPKKALISTQDFELAHVDKKELKRHYK